ncbi:MAG TPA: PQQ-binding-like beta-propeller repeat protein [Acidimicrobiia bacterium]|jgi:polyvinyl alcohol dehydrogenase (cytochrome)
MSPGRGRALAGNRRAFVALSAALCAALPGVLAACSSGGSSPHSTDWTVYGHDLANTRLAPSEKSISAKTVASLRVAWSSHEPIGVTGTPVVAHGVVYYGDWAGTVHAVNAKTGSQIWATPGGGTFIASPAVSGDGVFVASGATLARLDRATGKLEWKVTTNDNPAAGIDASPVVVGHTVLQATASNEEPVAKKVYTFRGSIGGYDTRTGKELWRFYTTKDNAQDGPGVGLWSTPAVDTKRKLLYIGSGNAYSEPTGPLADSILAIDYRTGKLRWSRQFRKSDVFSAGHPESNDTDVGASPNMWTVNGRDLVGAGDKAGEYHALDRDTGRIVWQADLSQGDVFGGALGSGAFVDDKLIVTSNNGGPTLTAPNTVARVYALDPATGRIVWQAKPLPQKIFGPVSAVPGVAFVGNTAGTYVALDTRTGARLWSYQAPSMVGGGASIVDGRLYWGYGFVLFQGGGSGGLLAFDVRR